MQAHSTTLIEKTGVTINLGFIERIPPGEGRDFLLGDEEITVFRLRNGQVHALEAKCPHRNGPLADGLTGDGKVICPYHSYKFELATGKPIGNDCQALKTYNVEVSSTGEILLHF
ncbi:MAG TPA: Rieske 2Fe-2S domain-containing protein [Blastocatellia bacterium]|nr:Rieske 2Fe-2S domain-containing protein [Blastocatellia bacterium]